MALTADGNLTQLSDTGYTRSDIVNFFNNLASKYGASVESSDIDHLIAKLMGESGCIRQLGGDPQRCFNDFEEQYKRRGGAAGQGDTPNVGSHTVENPDLTPTVGGVTYEDTDPGPGIVFAPQRAPAPAPVPVASMVVGDMGVTAGAVPTVGPTGLANPSLPINYATGQVGGEFGYNGYGGAAPSAAPRSSSMMPLLLLGGAAVAAFLLLKKKK